jgi:hypothetical protein
MQAQATDSMVVAKDCKKEFEISRIRKSKKSLTINREFNSIENRPPGKLG